MDELATRFGDGRAHLEIGLDLEDPAAIERARGLLADIDGVVGVDPGKRPSDPWMVTIRSNDEAVRVRSAALATVAEQGLPLTSIRQVVPSLEEIYRRAVSGTAGARVRA
jgi:hypothetical protein